MTEYTMSKSKRLDELIKMVQISKDDKLNSSDIKEPSSYKTRFLSGRVSDKIFEVIHDGEVIESECIGNFICIKDYNYALHYVHTIDYERLSLLEIMCNNDNQHKLIEALEELENKLMKGGKNNG